MGDHPDYKEFDDYARDMLWFATRTPEEMKRADESLARAEAINAKFQARLTARYN